MSTSIKPSANLWTLIILLLFICPDATSQSDGPGLIGKTFIALNVSNADSTAAWYEDMFGVKLLKEIKIPDGYGHIRIEGNEHLMVEILRAKDSWSLAQCNLDKENAHLLRGYFKTGFFVEDIRKAREYFKVKSGKVVHDIFRDEETATLSFIIEDPNGNMLQFIQSVR